MTSVVACTTDPLLKHPGMQTRSLTVHAMPHITFLGGHFLSNDSTSEPLLHNFFEVSLFLHAVSMYFSADDPCNAYCNPYLRVAAASAIFIESFLGIMPDFVIFTISFALNICLYTGVLFCA
jgi:hypothetical protein